MRAVARNGKTSFLPATLAAKLVEWAYIFICMDAMEHICPEDYPGILRGFQKALKPGGVLYFTADREEEPDFDLEMYFERGKAAGLPVVFGEVADEAAFEQAMKQTEVSDELTDRAVYHYYPPLEKVRE